MAISMLSGLPVNYGSDIGVKAYLLGQIVMEDKENPLNTEFQTWIPNIKEGDEALVYIPTWMQDIPYGAPKIKISSTQPVRNTQIVNAKECKLKFTKILLDQNYWKAKAPNNLDKGGINTVNMYNDYMNKDVVGRMMEMDQSLRIKNHNDRLENCRLVSDDEYNNDTDENVKREDFDPEPEQIADKYVRSLTMDYKNVSYGLVEEDPKKTLIDLLSKYFERKGHSENPYRALEDENIPDEIKENIKKYTTNEEGDVYPTEDNNTSNDVVLGSSSSSTKKAKKKGEAWHEYFIAEKVKERKVNLDSNSNKVHSKYIKVHFNAKTKTTYKT